jgi:hypothetical protein
MRGDSVIDLCIVFFCCSLIVFFFLALNRRQQLNHFIIADDFDFSRVLDQIGCLFVGLVLQDAANFFAEIAKFIFGLFVDLDCGFGGDVALFYARKIPKFSEGKD